MRRRGLGAVAAALLVAGCGWSLSPSGAPSPAPWSSGAAAFVVKGSGEVCGPWWMGCGAVLAVEAPGWTVPEGWSPNDGDTQFAIDLRPGHDGPMRVTGIRPGGQDRIEPGQHRLVVILTMSPDNASPGTWIGRFGCAADVSVPPGTRMVVADVVFGPSCTISVAVDAAMPEPSN